MLSQYSRNTFVILSQYFAIPSQYLRNTLAIPLQYSHNTLTTPSQYSRNTLATPSQYFRNTRIPLAILSVKGVGDSFYFLSFCLSSRHHRINHHHHRSSVAILAQCAQVSYKYYCVQFTTSLVDPCSSSLRYWPHNTLTRSLVYALTLCSWRIHSACVDTPVDDDHFVQIIIRVILMMIPLMKSQAFITRCVLNYATTALHLRFNFGSGAFRLRTFWGFILSSWALLFVGGSSFWTTSWRLIYLIISRQHFIIMAFG